jgi:membrane protease YdiL (CAAX protease family)
MQGEPERDLSAADVRPLTRRQEGTELGVFLLLIVPGMVLSFFGVRQAALPFPLVAASTMLRDVALVALVLLLLARARQPLTAIGWTFRRLGRDAALGFVLSIPVLVGSQALAVALRDLGLPGPQRSAPDLVPTPDAAELVLAVLLVAVVAIAEETVFRGYLILRFRGTLGGNVSAVVLSSVVFAFGHGYEGAAGIVTVGLTGMVFALVYVWRKSLVAPMVMHAAFDLVALVLAPVLSR